MTKLGFFSAVTYGNQPTTCTQKILEKMDDYLHLGSTRYQVIDPKKGEVTLKELPRSFWTTALKVTSYALLIPVLVALIAKILLRCACSFTVVKQIEPSKPLIELPKPIAIESKVKTSVISVNIKPGDSVFRIVQDELTKGIDLKGVREKVVQVMKKEDDIRNLSFLGLVFAIPEYPELIFRTGHTTGTFDDLVRARCVIKRNKLDRLILPQAARFEAEIKGEGKEFIAQQRLNFNPDPDVQKGLSFALSRDEEMKETVKQLTRFIVAMKCSKISVFFLSETDHRVAIVNADYGDCSYSFSNEYIKRLIGKLFSEELIDIVIGEAFGTEAIPLEIQQAKEQQIESIQKNRGLYEFYLEKGIFSNPLQPIAVDDFSKLLDSEPNRSAREKKEKLYKSVVARINKDIETHQAYTYRSMQGKRLCTVYEFNSTEDLEGLLKWLCQEEIIYSYKKINEHSFDIQT